ncbi:MAG: DUF333 domain-containing protein [Pseudobdellovibrio sp.]
MLRYSIVLVFFNLFSVSIVSAKAEKSVKTQDSIVVNLPNKEMGLSEIKLVYINNFLVTEKCLKIKCQALYSKIIRQNKPSTSFKVGHPAAKNCIELGGFNFIGKLSSGAQIDICRFSDGSMGESWSLTKRRK